MLGCAVASGWSRLGRPCLAGLIALGTPACRDQMGPPEPRIVAFRADRVQVDMESEVELEAVFENGTGTVDGRELPPGGRVRVRPATTTTYTLAVTGRNGKAVSRSVKITVNPGLSVEVLGQGGVAGEVTLTGPGGFHRTLAASGVFTGLVAGEYTLRAAPEQREGTFHHPWRPEQRLTITTGTRVQVLYPAPAVDLLLPGGARLAFRLIPAGTFVMGEDHPADPRRVPSPSPAHAVTFRQAFYMAAFPTTRAQWASITGDPEAGSPDEAVNEVSFREIQTRFLPALNRILPGHAFRLPSEAEWEYACRAGTTTPFFHGEDAARIQDYAWSLPEFLEKRRSVGTKLPNPWGLHDLAGLLAQWCEDVAHGDYRGAPGDGQPWSAPGTPLQGNERIVRGYGPVSGRKLDFTGCSFDRHRLNEEIQAPDVGFRLVAENPILE